MAFSIGIVGFVLFIGLGSAFLPSALLQSGVAATLVAGTTIYGFLLLIPISIAVAILRSRLYDIDIIINRTLVYGALSAILGTLYAGFIIGLESLAGLITGPGSQQPLRESFARSALQATRWRSQHAFHREEQLDGGIPNIFKQGDDHSGRLIRLLYPGRSSSRCCGRDHR